MNVNEFFEKYNNISVDYDGYYGNQCVDLYRQYVKECLEYPQGPGVGGAADIWDSYKKDYYERIENTPDAVPQLGDIIIWKKTSDMHYGHVAIFSSGDVNKFISFDQNWPIGSACHFQSHNYRNVQGWIRPNKYKEQTPKPTITDNKTKIDLGDPYGVQEVQAIKSMLLDRDKNLEHKDSSIHTLQDANDKLNKEIKDLNAQLAGLKKTPSGSDG